MNAQRTMRDENSIERKVDKRPDKNETTRFVYLLQHGFGKYGDERVKILGIFHSKNAALVAKKMLKTKPGFRIKGGKFSLDAYEVDKIFWSEGFGS